MTIPELKIYVDSQGGQAMNRKNITWNLIFDMYKRATGNRLSTGCGSCYKKAYRWLQNQ